MKLYKTIVRTNGVNHNCAKMQKVRHHTQVISSQDDTLIELDSNDTGTSDNGRLSMRIRCSTRHHWVVVEASIMNSVVVLAVDVVARSTPIDRIMVHF